MLSIKIGNYLTQFDFTVIARYEERLKLHVGILLTVGDFHYYVPISSFQRSMFFHKLQDDLICYAVLKYQ